VPTAHNDGVALGYEVAGRGPTVAFCGEAGLGPWQHGWQYAAIAGPSEAVVPETRGIGASDAPPGPYAVADLAADLSAVLSAHGARRVHLVGYGLGGMVALSLALSSDRPASLAVVGTPPAGDAFDPGPLWAPPDDRAAVAASTERLLSAGFVDRRPGVVDRITDWRTDEDAARPVWEAHRAAAAGFDLADRPYELTTPTLVIQGTDDRVCPPAAGRSLAAGLPRGELFEVEAGHLAGVETARPVNDELVGWLDEHADRGDG